MHGAQIDCHEMLDGKYGRPFDTRNYLALCRGRYDRPGCHELCKGSEGTWPALSLAIQQSVKMTADPANWDRAWMLSIYGVGLPEPAPIPEVFIVERMKNLGLGA